MKLHSRIFLLLLLTLIGLGATSIAFLYVSTKKIVESDARERLSLAQSTFYDAMRNQREYLNTSVETVAKDWGLRQSAATLDKTTLESVLENHSSRINAHIALFADNDGRIQASTLPETSLLTELTTPAYAAISGKTLDFISEINGRYYQLVLTKVLAPVQVGWVAMGFAVDDRLAEYYSELTDVQISFVRKLGTTELELVASSLDNEKRQELGSINILDSDHIGTLKYSKGEDLVLIGQLKHSEISVLLQRSLSDPLARFNSWWWSLLSIFMLIALIALSVAYVFSRGITKPLNQLLLAVKGIARGDYSTPIKIRRSDEIGFLAKAFQTMQQAIAEREEEIQYRADHDIVTSILNRNGFLNRLDQLVHGQNERPLAVASCRLNHFPEINDALGHSWGDKLLQLVADRLDSGLSCEHIAHVNMDEFACAFRIENVTEAYSIATAMEQVFSAEFNLRGIELTLSITSGIAVYPDHGTDSQSLLRRASVALNEAAERQVSSLVYDSELDQNSVKRIKLMSELPTAIRDEQITLHFQPKLRCHDLGQTVESVECLVRWTHPELGFIAPDEFIGLAEKTGYILELTEWLIDKALQQHVKWQKNNYNIAMAVNISALDLSQTDFADRVAKLLESYHIPPENLILEVTESAAMKDPETAIHQLSALADVGVRLSIDDYGTGYSSLAQLKKLPVDELKIDRSFVMDLSRDQDDQIIVRSTIELGHNIGLSVVAEGVEDEATMKRLLAWGCDYIQGYHIARPMAESDFDAWLAESRFPARTSASPTSDNSRQLKRA